MTQAARLGQVYLICEVPRGPIGNPGGVQGHIQAVMPGERFSNALNAGWAGSF